MHYTRFIQFYANRITQYVFFREWLLVHITCVWNSFILLHMIVLFSFFIVLFLSLLLYRFPFHEKYYNLSIFPLVDFWVVSSFGLIRCQKKLQKTFNQMRKELLCPFNGLPRVSSGPFGVIWFYRHLHLCFDWVILQYCKL